MFLSHINVCISVSVVSFSLFSIAYPSVSPLPLILLTSHKTRGRHENKNQYGSCRALCGKEENV